MAVLQSGYAKDELIGMTVFDLHTPGTDSPAAIIGYWNNWKPGERYIFELDHVRKDGSIYPVEVVTGRVVFADAELMFALVRDITERREAEEQLQEITRYTRGLIEASLDPLVTISLEGLIMDVNRATEQVTGFSREELIGTDFADYFTEPDRAREGYAGAFTSGFVKDYPLTICHRSGQTTDVLYNASVYSDESGAMLGVFAAARDITERKAAKEAIQEHRNLLNSIFQSIQDGISVLNTDLTIREVNQTMEKWYDHAVPFIGQKCYEVYQNRLTPCISCPSIKALEKKTVCSEIVPLMGDNKQVGWLELFCYPLIDTKTERVTGVVEFVRDITERKLAEESLLMKTAAIDSSINAIAIADLNGIVTYINPAFLSIWGYEEPEEVLGRSVPEFYVSEQEAEQVVLEVQKYGTWYGEIEGRRKDGSPIPLELSAGIVRDASGAPIAIMGSFIDITERREAEHHLAAAQKRLKEAHQLANIGIWDWMMETDSMTWSEELYAIAGRDPALPALNYRNHQPLYTPASWERLEPALHTTLKTGKSFNLELEMVRPDGTIRHVHALGHQSHDMNGNLIGLHGTVQDITDRKLAEEALHTANKKLQLLSGITRHDIKNKIMALRAYLDLSRAEIDDPILSGYLGEIESAATAIQKQIEFTGVYEELGAKEPAWQSISGIIAAINDDARIPIRHACPDIVVYADPMFEKIMHNLYENTIRHAEGATGVWIRCEEQNSNPGIQDSSPGKQDSNPGKQDSNPGKQDGGLVITWEDNGAGIPDDQKERIFEKGVGRNTGFGLFLAREILSITGITIAETGVYGEGARFEIHVPASGFKIER